MAQLSLDHNVKSNNAFELDIGCDHAEVRWWAAILAGGRGWQATMTRGDNVYFPPWELHLSSNSFRIRHYTDSTSCPTSEPPSSAMAQEYLYNFARCHDAFDQLIGALAATLTLPMHNRFGAAIVLPRPMKRCEQYGSHQRTDVTFADQIPKSYEIPRYMTFSATSGLLVSCLFKGLWEPGIPCNLANEWLDPAMKEVMPFLHTKQAVPVIWALSERRPNLAPLWLGATITGLLPRIFQVSKSFLPTIYLEGVTWTQSSQSFMDPIYHRLVKTYRKGEKAMISREDEFRLLFLTDTGSETYGVPPLCPYAPIGDVDIQHSSIEVRLHHSCDHRLMYRSWEWVCQKGGTLSDFGVPNEPDTSKALFQNISLPSAWVATWIACSSILNKTLPNLAHMASRRPFYHSSIPWISANRRSSHTGVSSS